MKFTFAELIGKLQGALEGGDFENIPGLLAGYSSDNDDWMKYATENPDPGCTYTRNSLKTVGTDKGQILLILWKPETISAIHSHNGAQCWVKLLDGQIEESLYSPDDMKHAFKTGTVRRDEICYIDDTIGLHAMENRLSETRSVSLHVYSSSAVLNGPVLNGNREETNPLGIYMDFSEEF